MAHFYLISRHGSDVELAYCRDVSSAIGGGVHSPYTISLEWSNLKSFNRFEIGNSNFIKEMDLYWIFSYHESIKFL